MAQNNTYKHISDESKYSTFNPMGTQYPQSVKTVQEALALTSPTSPATEQGYGVIKLATMTQVMAGTDDTSAVTPLKLAQRLQHPDATTAQKGIIQIATNEQALAGTDTNKAIVSSSLKHVVEWLFANRVSTEISNGVLKLSTESAAKSGTDHTTAMTPLRVKQAIAEATKLIPSYTTATETVAGLVQLATAGQVQQGTLRAGVAVSPYSLSQLTGNETRRGIVQAATLAQANAGTDQSVYISAAGFKSFNANTTNFGTVKLSETVQSGVGLALSANAKVLPTTGGTVTGVLTVNGSINLNGSEVSSKKHVVDNIPVGSVQMWLGSNAPAGGLWALCDGGAESKTNRPDLFAVIGYNFGGSGDLFYRPDMRGLFVRGAGVGKDILAEFGLDSNGKPKLGVGVSGGAVGTIQKQQVLKHKHVHGYGEQFGGQPFFWGYSSQRKYGGAMTAESWDNFLPFTNDGSEVESETITSGRSRLNGKDVIGDENRPWNMSVNYIIKVA